MSTLGTRRPCAYMPLRLPLSIATQRPWSNRSTKWAREISGWAMRTSARRSRPITTSLPGAKVRVEPSYRTVSAGGAGRLIGPNSIGTVAGWGAGPWGASRRRPDTPPRGVGDLLQTRDSVTARSDDVGERGVDGRTAVAGRAP